MRVDPRAGKPATPAMLVNVPRFVPAYFAQRPDPGVPAQRVAFGTSGQRGSSFDISRDAELAKIATEILNATFVGHGLGLSIAKGLAEAQESTVWYTPRPGGEYPTG